MRIVVQRVSRASVKSEGTLVGQIGKGLMVLIGVEEGDTEKDAIAAADKMVGLRIFEDAEDKMNLSVQDVGGEILTVSQFTLLGDARKGKRPSFIAAARPEAADRTAAGRKARSIPPAIPSGSCPSSARCGAMRAWTL